MHHLQQFYRRAFNTILLSGLHPIHICKLLIIPVQRLMLIIPVQRLKSLPSKLNCFQRSTCRTSTSTKPFKASLTQLLPFLRHTKRRFSDKNRLALATTTVSHKHPPRALLYQSPWPSSLHPPDTLLFRSRHQRTRLNIRSQTNLKLLLQRNLAHLVWSQRVDEGMEPSAR